MQEGSADGQVAVDGQAGQVEDGHGAHHDVKAGRQAAHRVPQQPHLVVQLLVDPEGHDQQRHAHVGDGQGHDEGVGLVPQLAVGQHGQDGDEVAHHGQQRHQQQDDRHAVRRRLAVLRRRVGRVFEDGLAVRLGCRVVAGPGRRGQRGVSQPVLHRHVHQRHLQHGRVVVAAYARRRASVTRRQVEGGRCDVTWRQVGGRRRDVSPAPSRH